MLDRLFDEIFGAPPSIWQRAAYDAFVAGTLPRYIKVPTAGGKTAILAIFLAALATQAGTQRITLPRRLALVVNRRSLVDQSSALAAKLADIVRGGTLPALSDALATLSPRGIPLSVSTLRGALADNGDWAIDPATPALILGTPDMIGSRLLFRGYGVGRSRAATHAGLLGIDTLVVHDEAHLAPVFSSVLREIEVLARRSADAVGRPPLHVVEMTATPDPHSDVGQILECRVSDDPALARRMRAGKALTIIDVSTNATKGKPAARVLDMLAEQALAHKNACKAVALFVHRPEAANHLTGRLLQGGVPLDRIVTLTGTQRASEREHLIHSPAFMRFSPERPDEGAPTAYFICTSAGEIGLDIDADIGLLDLVTLDRFIQRAGRINRRGCSSGELTLVHACGEELGDALTERSRTALRLLDGLPHVPAGRDASPIALTQLTEHPRYREAVPAVPPRRSLEPSILTQWSMTALRLDALRVPPPDIFLHGLDDEDHDVDLVWRTLPADTAQLTDWLEAWPVLAHERAKLPLHKARDLIEAVLKRAGHDDHRHRAVLVLDSQGRVVEHEPVTTDRSLRGLMRLVVPGRTVIIRDELGGLSPAGLPDIDSIAPVVDVSAEGRGEMLTLICSVGLADGAMQWSHVGEHAESLPALVAMIRPDHEIAFAEELVLPVSDLMTRDDSTVHRRARVWLHTRQVSGPDAGDLASLNRCDRTLIDHLELAHKAAHRLLQHIDLPPMLATAVATAAAHHDVGKQEPRWQAALGNPTPAVPLAKSRRPVFDVRLNDGYRHELGSVVMLGEQVGMLERHLIAAHHGWARPGFTEKARTKPGCSSIADRVAKSFAKLNEHFGPWGLAYLEAMVKSADVLAELEATRLAEHPLPSPRTIVTKHDEEAPGSAIEIPADARNFGEYLACLGLLDLLARFRSGLSACWTARGFSIVGADDAAVLAAVDALLTVEASVDEAALRDDLHGEKFPPLRLRLSNSGHQFYVNGWLAMDYGGNSRWKLSAGQTDALAILRGLVSAAHTLRSDLVTGADLFRLGTTMKERFRFDAATSWSALDAGFTLNEDDRFSTARPFVELLSILGLQHAFVPPGDQPPCHYVVWHTPLPAALCLPAAKGLMSVSGERYRPRLVTSGKMKDVFTSELTLSNEESTWLPNHLIV
ncbi:type I-U CRISPR-associated helicase/endonuclease Cas3 [Aromatoleum toluolicum]|uniref:Type I-U CRISPR-associated helicase/endonuclease Cas3 n=1 Tax=Aromatoleum toluolicum TaxID=90060 RepID=A0ABX1NA26_9RHOO|nr:type I-U CRISPR-associated helicase/endonuclease Cas3 [Aromatoleum toluolicum]NMF96138.1 type I-U CRISPR-associated helicase/endonuclease Cas3 [Aromatoleum toluolicum]